MFPVSVLIIEPNVLLETPAYNYDADANRTYWSNTTSSWEKCSYIKLLATKNDLPSNAQRACERFLLLQILEKYNTNDVYASTRLDPRIFKTRDKESVNPIPGPIKNYYEPLGTADWLAEKDVMDVYEKTADVCPTEAEVLRGRVESLSKQRMYTPGPLKPYTSTSAVMSVYEYFAFSQLTPHNPDVTVDDNNPMELDYDSHMVVWTTAKNRNNLPKINDHQYRVVNANNKFVYSLKFTEYDPSKSLKDSRAGDFTLDVAMKYGFFQGFNYFWKWTYTPKFVLNQPGKVIRN